jgi:hypothetical protein
VDGEGDVGSVTGSEFESGDFEIIRFVVSLHCCVFYCFAVVFVVVFRSLTYLAQRGVGSGTGSELDLGDFEIIWFVVSLLFSVLFRCCFRRCFAVVFVVSNNLSSRRNVTVLFNVFYATAVTRDYSRIGASTRA